VAELGSPSVDETMVIGQTAIDGSVLVQSECPSVAKTRTISSTAVDVDGSVADELVLSEIPLVDDFVMKRSAIDDHICHESSFEDLNSGEATDVSDADLVVDSVEESSDNEYHTLAFTSLTMLSSNAQYRKLTDPLWQHPAELSYPLITADSSQNSKSYMRLVDYASSSESDCDCPAALVPSDTGYQEGNLQAISPLMQHDKKANADDPGYCCTTSSSEWLSINTQNELSSFTEVGLHTEDCQFCRPNSSSTADTDNHINVPSCHMNILPRNVILLLKKKYVGGGIKRLSVISNESDNEEGVNINQ
jgi:hypothetical protein